MKLYLDASAVIFFLQGSPPARTAMAERLARSREGGDEVFLSDLTRFECRVGPLREGQETVLAAYERFFASKGTRLVPVSRKAWDYAAQVRARHGLKTLDALHVACAVTLGCDLLITGDERMARCPEVKTELVVP